MIRVLLDEHLSGPVIGEALSEAGHDVRAADTDEELRGSADPDLISLADREERVLVTANIADFRPPLELRQLEEQSHPGVVFIPGKIPTNNFGDLISGLLAAFEEHPAQSDWIDREEWIVARRRRRK